MNNNKLPPSKTADDFNVSIWFAVYPGDFLTDTAHLSNEEIGILMKFLCSYWRNDTSLKNNDKHLSRIAGITTRRWKAIRQNLESLFIIKNDAWHNKALSGERYKATLNRMHKRRAAYVKHGNAEKISEINHQIDHFIDANSMHLHNNCTANAPKKSMHLQCPLPSPAPLPLPIHTSALPDEEDTSFSDKSEAML